MKKFSDYLSVIQEMKVNPGLKAGAESKLINLKDLKKSVRKKIFIMVGPPAIGKSTFIKKIIKNYGQNNVQIISRDDIVERISIANSLTYDDLFITPTEVDANKYPSSGEKEFGAFGKVELAPSWMSWTKYVWSNIKKINDLVQSELQTEINNASKNNKMNIIVDMTNMTPEIRKSMLVNFKGNSKYYKIAIDFGSQLDAEKIQYLIKNAEKRNSEHKESGRPKTIGADVINRMIAGFKAPKMNEGFDEIIKIKNFDEIIEKNNLKNWQPKQETK